mgnify:FL=1
MPLTMVQPGEVNIIKKITGKDDVRQHLAELGFVVGAQVTVVSRICGNVIVAVKESRVAIGNAMAARVIV